MAPTARVVVTTLACLVLATVLRAGQAPPAARDPPTFKAGIRYVEVDVTVLDQKGRLVRDLAREEFELTEDGLPHAVADFRLVDIPVPPRQPRHVPAPRGGVDRDVATNTGSGRIYVMLLEAPPDMPFGHNYLTQRAARWFVEKALGPDDLMAVIHVQGSLTAAQSFTSSRQQLLASIDRLTLSGWGQDPLVAEPALSLVNLNTYEMIRYVAERLGSIGARRKAILWIGGFVPFFHRDAGEAVAYREAIRAANRNNVAVYPIDPEGLTVTMGRAELERQGALRAVAEDTGGDAIVNTNNFEGGYERIVEQNSAYYVLGYYPMMEHDDGAFHDIKVRVRRKGLTVRARKGYVAPSPASRAAANQPMPGGLSTASLDALRSVVPVGDLGIDMFLAPFKGAGANGSVLLGARLRGRDLTRDGQHEIEVSHLTIDAAGAVSAGTRRSFALNLRPDGQAQIESAGLRYFDRLDLPPGRHEVRLVVHQPGGSTGSVVAHVEVPDFDRAPLTMSGLVLSSLNDAPQRTLLGDDTASRTLTVDPTLNREFVSGDVLTVWAEAYRAVKAADAQVRVTSRITPERGEDPLVTRARLLAPVGDDDRRRFVYQDRFALSELPPGGYVLTVEAKTTDGKHAVRRQLPFAIAD
jgi:VWFA-related protein